MMIRNIGNRSANRFCQLNQSIQRTFPCLLYLKESISSNSKCFSHLKCLDKYDHRILSKNQSSTSSRAKYCVLSENEYGKIAEDTLESLSDYLDELLEKQTKLSNYDLSLSSGVLTINLDSFGTYVINKQTPNRQIWLSSPISGPKRYDYMDGVWIHKHDNCSLHDLLNHEFTSILELNDIDFSGKCEYGKR